MAEERVVDELDLEALPQRPAQAEDGGGIRSHIGLFAFGLAVLGIAGVLAFLMMNHQQISNLHKELAAKADWVVVAREIARLDSAKAERSELGEVRNAVGSLTDVAKTLNSRVVTAEENLRKNRAAAAAAAGSAKKAAELAREARNELARLDKESGERWTGTTRSLDSLHASVAGVPREVDSRVGPLAADLSSFRRDQETVNAANTAAVNAFRQKLRLMSDKDLARLAAAFSERRARQSSRR